MVEINPNPNFSINAAALLRHEGIRKSERARRRETERKRNEFKIDAIWWSGAVEFTRVPAYYAPLCICVCAASANIVWESLEETCAFLHQFLFCVI